MEPGTRNTLILAVGAIVAVYAALLFAPGDPGPACRHPDCSADLERDIDERYRLAVDATEGPD